jgi:hypothetical protein
MIHAFFARGARSSRSQPAGVSPAGFAINPIQRVISDAFGETPKAAGEEDSTIQDMPALRAARAPQFPWGFKAKCVHTASSQAVSGCKLQALPSSVSMWISSLKAGSMRTSILSRTKPQGPPILNFICPPALTP